MVFFTKFFTTLAGMSSTTITVLVAVIIVILVIVYFKYIKPTFIKFVDNQNTIKRTSENIEDIKKDTNNLHSIDSVNIQELLNTNNSHLENIIKILEDMKAVMSELSNDIDEHDKNYTDKHMEMLLELNRLSIKLESNMINVRGVR